MHCRGRNVPFGEGTIYKLLRNRLLCPSRRSWQSSKISRSLQSRWDTNGIPVRAAFASPADYQGFAMNLRKKSTREEFERVLAQCKPEDFDGHTEFYRLTP